MVGDVIHLLNEIRLLVLVVGKVKLAWRLGKALRVESIVVLLCGHHSRGGKWLFPSHILVAAVDGDALLAVLDALSTTRLSDVESLVLVDLHTFLPDLGYLLLLIGQVLSAFSVHQVLLYLTLPLVLNAIIPHLSRLFGGGFTGNRDSWHGGIGTTAGSSELCASLFEVLRLDNNSLVVLSLIHITLIVLSSIALGDCSLVAGLLNG